MSLPEDLSPITRQAAVFPSNHAHLFGLLGNKRSLVSSVSYFHSFPANKDERGDKVAVRLSAPFWIKPFFMEVLLYRNIPSKTLLLLLLCLLPCVFFPQYVSSWTNSDPHCSVFKFHSDCSTFRVMYDVLSIVVFCGESVGCFPGMAFTFVFCYYSGGPTHY